MDRPGLRDLRGQRADVAENGFQMVYVEPAQRGQPFRLESHDDFCGGTAGWTHTNAILAIEKAENATTHGDFGNIAASIGKARYWPFRTGWIGPDGKDPTAEIMTRISAPSPIVRRRSRRPKARRTRDERLRSGMVYSRLGSAPL
jgi:hypothetical protein